ncbi:MAG: hypothetical protein WD557_05310 [Dehalococcoidia bacterium]
MSRGLIGGLEYADDIARTAAAVASPCLSELAKELVDGKHLDAEWREGRWRKVAEVLRDDLVRLGSNRSRDNVAIAAFHLVRDLQ